MSLFDVLRHQWRRQVRSPTWGRSLVGGLLLVAAAAYFGLLFVGLGWFYPDMVAEVAPRRDPLRLLNRHLLTGCAGLLAARFLLQRSSGSDARPYLPLPVRRRQLVRVMQAISALSLFNLLPVVLLATLWGSTVRPATSALGAAEWGIGALLAVAATQFANSALRAAWDRNAGLVLGGAVVAVGAALAGPALGMGGVPTLSAWLFDGLSAGRWPPLIGMAAVTAGLSGGAHRALRARLYDVLGGPGPASSGTAPLTGLGRGHGGVLSLAVLDAKLILRNKRPRQMMLAGLVAVAAFLFALLIDSPTPPFNQILFGFILSGYLGLTYGQFGYAWHGRHFDGLLTRAIPSSTLVRGQFATFVVLSVAPLVVLVPLTMWVRPVLLTPLGALFLYNVGVTAPVLLGLGVWGRTALVLNQSAFFNYQGTATHHFIAVLPVMALPIGLVVWRGMAATLLVVTGLGLLGIATTPLWTRGIGTLLRRQRYDMAAGFREEE